MTHPSAAHFGLLARYNRLANERLYAACAELADTERKKDRRAFFSSIHGTLNHILLGDRIWLARFAGEEVPSTGLDTLLYEDFVAGLDEAELEGEIRYRNNEGVLVRDPKALLLAHLFNHQTHHRGQVHDMLCQTGVTPPVLDLHRVLRPSSEAAVRDSS